MLKILNASVFLMIAIFNIITEITKGSPFTSYLITVLPFILFATAVFIMGGKKSNALIFAAIGILTTLYGVEDNATGIIFISFSIYLFNRPLSNIVLIGLSLIAIVCKFMFLDLTVSQAVNMIIAYMYIGLIYYILFHPKPKKSPVKTVICPELDTETIRILQKLYQGYIPKQLTNMIYLSSDAINKRIGRAREKMGAKTTAHLLAICQQKGYIGLDMDIETH